jgi:predicted Zn finger-like uncharacterized protein
MYSQCPSCKARFRVTAATLRAAHGRGRCGHCGHKFDVLEHLSDDFPAASGTASPTAGDSPRPPAQPPALADGPRTGTEADADGVGGSGIADGQNLDLDDYHFSAEDIEKVFIDARDWQKQFGDSSALRSSAPSESPAAEQSEFTVDEPRRVEDIKLEGVRVEIEGDNGEPFRLEAEFDHTDEEDVDEISDLDSTSRLPKLENVPDSAYPADEDESPLKEDETAFYRALIEGRDLPSAASAVTGARPTPPRAAAPARRPARGAAAPMRAGIRATPAERWTEGRRSRVVADDLPDLDLRRTALPPHRGRRWFALGSALLALALAAQATHYYRQIIARHPQAGDALRRVYALIGQPLSPNWDLDAFEVHQWGPTADVAPGEPLTIRASLTNRAAHAQPYPLLRLEFEDRFGAAVARRDFMPAEYLKNDQQAARQFAAGETTETELSVVAPGGDAVGYTLDICLREELSRIRCAHGGD